MCRNVVWLLVVSIACLFSTLVRSAPLHESKLEYSARQADELCTEGFSIGFLPSYTNVNYETDITCTVFPSVDFTNVNFTTSDLQGVFFSLSTQNNVRFRGSTLNFTEFSNCTLQQMETALVKFHNGYVAGSQVGDSKFTATSFLNTRFTESSIQDTVFLSSNMTKVEFNGGVSIESSNFSTVNLESSTIRDTTFSNVIFFRATFDSSSVTDTTISSSRFTGSSAEEASFQSLTIVDSVISTTDFEGASMPSTQLRGVSIRRSNFEGADLSNTVWDSDCSIENSDFESANLMSADLRGVTIDEASDFTNANCEGMQIDGGCVAFCDQRGCDCGDSVATPTPTPVSSATATPAPSTLPEEATPTPTPVCIDADWVASNHAGFEVHAHSSVQEVFCFGTLPCATAGHVVERAGVLLTMAELCAEDACTVAEMHVNGVQHVRSALMPCHGDVCLTTLDARSGTIWKRVENRIVNRLLKFGNRAIAERLTRIQLAGATRKRPAL